MPGGINPEGNDPPPPSPRLAELMLQELDAMQATDQFRKAPKLARLLNYLVKQTLTGNGSVLKSYVVGIEALGREADFDAHVDSYPRVQVMRLRKMLETHYARHEPVDELCLYIPAGHYLVEMARRAKAYPELIRPAAGSSPRHFSPEAASPESIGSDTPSLAQPTSQFRTNEEGHTATGIEAIAADPATKPDGKLRMLRVAVAIFVIGLAASIVLWQLVASPTGDKGPASPRSAAPGLRIERPSSLSDPASQAVSDEVYAKLADGIGRFWVTQLLLDEPAEAPANGASTDYRLAFQVGEARSDGRPVYLRLTDAQTGTLIWSSNARIAEGQSLELSLGKNIVQLASPFGVIADREMRKSGGEFGSGYTCLLRYVDNFKTPQPPANSKLSDCLDVPIADPRLDAVRLSLQSFYIVETAPRENRKAAIDRARLLAKAAVNADPTEAYGHFAMARFFFIADDCISGMMSTHTAIEANGYDPILLAVLGNFAAHCGDPDGERLLQRAIEFRSPGESYARLSLILAAIRNGNTEQLPLLSVDGDPVSGVGEAYHYLCQTLIAAALDDRVEARRQWRKFAAVSAMPRGGPDAKLERVVLSQKVRTNIIIFLTKKDVLPAAAP